MATNDYDTHAQARAREFSANKNLVHAYIEKPAMYALLPGLKDSAVLCVGCGTGEECAELRGRGARVTGIDISRTSIAYATEHVAGVDFKVLDMDSTDIVEVLGQARFDFIYSSLTLHYSDNLLRLLKNLHALLKPGGQLLFSVGHPLRWAAEVVKEDNGNKSVLMGYRKETGSTRIFGNYLGTEKFTQKLSDGPEVTYWMRPVSAYFALLKDAGYIVREFQEPVPVDQSKNIDEEFWKLRTRLPVDMIFLAQSAT